PRPSPLGSHECGPGGPRSDGSGCAGDTFACRLFRAVRTHESQPGMTGVIFERYLLASSTRLPWSQVALKRRIARRVAKDVVREPFPRQLARGIWHAEC